MPSSAAVGTRRGLDSVTVSLIALLLEFVVGYCLRASDLCDGSFRVTLRYAWAQLFVRSELFTPPERGSVNGFLIAGTGACPVSTSYRAQK
jgi:hypothetical protein